MQWPWHGQPWATGLYGHINAGFCVLVGIKQNCKKCKQTTIKVAEVRAQKLELVGCIEKLLYFTYLRRCGPKACKPRSPKRAALRKEDSTSLFRIPAKKYPTGNCSIIYCSLNQQREITAHARAARKTSMPPKVHPIYGCTWGSFIEPFSGTSGGRARRARRALVRASAERYARGAGLPLEPTL